MSLRDASWRQWTYQQHIALFLYEKISGLIKALCHIVNFGDITMITKNVETLGS